MAEWSEPSVGDNNRLPWLETVEAEGDRGSPLRLVVLALLGIAIVAVLLFGARWWQSRPTAGSGDGALIAAPAGPYKVRPDDPGGLKVEGEGDTAIATSDGSGSRSGAIDMSRAPEAPVAAKPRIAPTPQPAGQARAVSAVPASGGRLVAAPPVGGTPGSIVQLGSYPDAATADSAWAASARRYGFLAGLGKSVQSAKVDGRTVYRLRVNAGSAGAAKALCARLKTAGAACFIPAG